MAQGMAFRPTTATIIAATFAKTSGSHTQELEGAWECSYIHWWYTNSGCCVHAKRWCTWYWRQWDGCNWLSAGGVQVFLLYEQATGESSEGHYEGEPVSTYSEENLALH